MASITIRNLDDELKRRPRVRTAENGRSLEEEAREIFSEALGRPSALGNLGQSIYVRFAVVEGTEVSTAQRGPRSATPDLM